MGMEWVHSPYSPSPDLIYDLVCSSFDLPQVKEAMAAAAADPAADPAGRSAVVDPEPYRHGERDSSSVWEAFVKVAWPCK
jgi:hypothetical protein